MKRRTVITIVVAVVAVIVAIPVAAYGYLVWTTNDAPERAALDDAPDAAAGGPSALDGTWTPAPVESNYVGYRVRERVGPVSAPSDAVGRSRAIDGSVTIDGTQMTTLDIAVDMTALRSDSSNRDEILRDQSIETGRFPTATFSLSAPVDIGAPEQGAVVELRVPGDLTLRDVMRPVTFDVQARWNGPTIQAAGSTRVELSDFGIETGGLAGFSVGGTGTIEFELTWAPAGAPVEMATPDTLVGNPETPTASDDVVPCQSDRSAPALASPMLVTTYSGAAAVVSGDGATSSAYTSAGRLGGAAWSPDGSTLLVAASPANDMEPSLGTVPSAGGALTPLLELADVQHPDWSSDGEIVFVKEEQGAGSDVWIADADGANARRLVATPGADRDPRWSPDGSRVVFTSLAGAQNEDVMVVRRDGSGLRSVASTEHYEYAPSFAPDGETVLFVRDGAVRIIGPDNEHSRALTDGPDDANPALSPDGSQLAFVRAGSLYVAGADGAQPSCVQTGEAIGGGPRWRPNPGVVAVITAGLTADPRADFRSDDDVRCVAEEIVDRFGVERLEELGLDTDAGTPPMLSVPGLTEPERGEVAAAYDGCLDPGARYVEGLVAEGLSEAEARCVWDAYDASGIPDIHLTEAPHGVSEVDTEEGRASLDVFLEGAELACRAWL